MSTYNYTKSPCDLPRLESEIRAATAITVALAHSTKTGSTISITFRANLSESEHTTLSTLVTNHVATPLPENTALPVEIRAAPSYGAKTVTLADGSVKKLYSRETGSSYTVEVGSNDLFFTISYPWVKLTGVEVINCEAGDHTDFEVYDTAAGTYSGVPNYKLNQFGFGVRLPKDYYKKESHFDADLYQGMKIKIKYTSASAKSIGLNFIMDEVK